MVSAIENKLHVTKYASFLKVTQFYCLPHV